MNLAALSGAALIAAISALLFAGFALGALRLTTRLSKPRVHGGAILNEPAQRHRDRWRALRERQAALLGAGAVFLLVFVLAVLLDAGRLTAALPDWQLVAITAIVAVAAALAVARFLRQHLRQRRLRLLRDANLVVGHALDRINANLNRSFHDVPCSHGMVDHVIAGLRGVYAVYVLARRPGRSNRLEVRADNLHFAGDGKPVKLTAFRHVAARLARECSKAIGQDFRIRTVVAVPGWEIEVQANEEVLIANERNLTMLSGWADERDYLMNDDVQALHALLTQRCTRAVIAD